MNNIKEMRLIDNIKTLLYFYKIAHREKPIYLLIVFFYIINQSLSPFINIVFSKYLIDGLIDHKNIKILLIYVIFIIFGNGILLITKNILQENIHKYEDWFEKYFNRQIAIKSIEMKFEYTEDPIVLNQIEKAKTGLSWYTNGLAGLTKCICSISTSFLMIFGVLYIILKYIPLLLMVSFITVFISTYYMYKRNTIKIKFASKLPKINRKFMYILFDLAYHKYGKDIRLYNASDFIMNKGKATVDEMTNLIKTQALEQQKWNLLAVFIIAIKDIFTFGYLASLILNKQISIGEFSMILAASNTFTISCILTIISNIQELLKNTKLMHEYVIFMHYDNDNYKGNIFLEDEDKLEIEFRNVAFKYPKAKDYTLIDVNLKINFNEHISIVGINGSGKTTLIKLICRLYDVTEGEILLNGININDIDYEQYISKISVVFQDFKLFSFSIKENIFFNDNIDLNDMKLNVLGMDSIIKKLKYGINTYLFKDFDELGIEPSGGEAQTIAIARALYKNSPIIILDEPTAALDPIAEYELYNYFHKLIKNKTAIFISHRMSSCKFCDKIVVINEKTIKEYGSHDELMKINNGLYKSLFNIQAQYYQ